MLHVAEEPFINIYLINELFSECAAHEMDLCPLFAHISAQREAAGAKATQLVGRSPITTKHTEHQLPNATTQHSCPAHTQQKFHTDILCQTTFAIDGT